VSENEFVKYECSIPIGDRLHVCDAREPSPTACADCPRLTKSIDRIAQVVALEAKLKRATDALEAIPFDRVIKQLQILQRHSTDAGHQVFIGQSIRRLESARAALKEVKSNKLPDSIQ